MPSFSLKAIKSKPIAYAASAALAVLGAGAVLLVLYVILLGPVHALDRVPASLARLKPLQTPRAAPDVAIADGEGGLHPLHEFRGRYVLINLWAPWCAPCVMELPALAALKKTLPAATLTVLAVNVGRDEAMETAQFLAAHKASGLGVWRDPNIALERAFRAYGLPATVLIDPSGKEVARAIGAAHWDAPDAAAYFRALPRADAKPAAKS